jgi:predicted dehydrogenase
LKAALPVGVIGVGALGRHHARHLATLDETHLVGVFDIDLERGRQVAAEVGTEAMPTLDALFARVEAVSVAVPTTEHAPVGLAALRRQIPVFIEKPLAANLEDADALVHTADEAGVQLQVGHIERFNRVIRAAAPYLDGPLYLESHRVAPFQPRGTDVAVVLDLMIHDLDLILHLTGGVEAVDVRANGISVLSPHLDIVNARVGFANGAVANATASRLARERVRRLRLFQPSGYLSLDLDQGTGMFMRLRPDWRPGDATKLEDVVEQIPLQAPEADALRLELKSFVHAVQGDREAVVTGHEGRRALALAMRVSNAVERSSVERLSVP